MKISESFRFQGQNRTLWSFTNHVDVACHRCANAAIIQVLDSRRRFTCKHCGASRFDVSRSDWLAVSPVPQWHGYRLWLQTPCRGEILWALNRNHLDYLHEYIAAGQREREQRWPHAPGVGQVLKPGWRGYHVTSRLPRWMVLKTSRPDVLRGLDRLKLRLPD